VWGAIGQNYYLHVWRIRRPEPDAVELAEAVAAIRAAKNPVIVAGGGVLYSGAEDLLADFAARRNIPFVETQAGKGGQSWEHAMNFGSPGVTGSACANALCETADLVIGIGTRFQDFTTGSWSLFRNPDRRIVSINLHGYDALKHGAIGVVGDAKVTLERLDATLGDIRFTKANASARTDWHAAVAQATAAPANDSNALPSDAQVIGAVQRVATEDTIAMCAAGKWSTATPAWATRSPAPWGSSWPRRRSHGRPCRESRRHCRPRGEDRRRPRPRHPHGHRDRHRRGPRHRRRRSLVGCCCATDRRTRTSREGPRAL
jgi:TPP-dependent trihydroxycyclohexane-1,2-dione (THcHDO) dehydratase